MRGGWPGAARHRPLTVHRLFVAGQVPAWPGRPHVCCRLAERSL